MQKIKNALASFAQECKDVNRAYERYATWMALPFYRKWFTQKPQDYLKGYIYHNVRLYEEGFTCIELRLSAFPSHRRDWKHSVELAVRDHNCGYLLDCKTLKKSPFLGIVSMEISDLLEDKLDEYVTIVRACHEK